MPAHPKYDWESIKRDYVEGIGDRDGEIFWPNLRELSEVHNVPYNRVREHAAKDGWSEQRSAYQSHVEKTRQRKRAEHLAKEAVDLDATALRMSKVGMQLVSERLGEVANAVMERRREEERQREAGQPPDIFGAVFSPSVDAREQEQLARAAAGWHALAGKALGEVPTTRTEVTGAEGVELSITQRLQEDDPDRVYGLLRAAERAGLLPGGDGKGGAPVDPAGGDPEAG